MKTAGGRTSAPGSGGIERLPPLRFTWLESVGFKVGQEGDP